MSGWETPRGLGVGVKRKRIQVLVCERKIIRESEIAELEVWTMMSSEGLNIGSAAVPGKRDCPLLAFMLGFPEHTGPVCSLRGLIRTRVTPRAPCSTEASNEMSKASPPLHVFLLKLFGTQLVSSIFRSL